MRSVRYLIPLILAAQSAWSLNSHPRIWLTPTLLTTLAAKRTAGTADWLALKASADAYKTDTVYAYQRTGCPGSDICYDYEGGDGPAGWYDAMFTLALVYQVTGDTSYSAKALEILDAANAPWNTSSDLSPITLDDGYPTRTMLPLLAIGFDWLYSQLSSTEKTQTIATINAAYTWYSTGASPIPYCRTGDPCHGPPYMNYLGGHLLGFGLAADATDGDNSNSTTIYTDIKSELTTALGYGLQADPVTVFPYEGNYLATGGFNGGAVSESYNYGTNHNERLWKLILAWKTSGRIDLTATYTPWMKASVKNLIYILRPNLWQAGDEGQMSATCNGVLIQFYPLFAAYLLNGTTEGAWAEYMYRNLATNPCSAIYAYPNIYEPFLWQDSTRTATNYNTLGLNYLSDSDGHLFSRSDWTSSGYFMQFNGSAGVFGEHQINAAGNIEVQHGSDYMLVSATTWQSLAGYGGTPNIASVQDNQYSNTFYFDDGGAWFYTGSNYLGGQGTWGATVPVAQRADAYVSYSLADLDTAYQKAPDCACNTGRSLSFYFRGVAQVAGSNAIFVWDRARGKSASYIKRLQWHLNPVTGAPTVSGSLISTVVGSSKIFIDTLSPSVSITTARDIATSDGTTPLTYNMQVAPTATSTDFDALTVIFPTSSGGSLPTTTLLSNIDANHVGAQIQDSTPAVVIYPIGVLGSGGGTYTSLTYTTVTFTTTHTGTANYLVTGLTPGTYSVFQNGAALSGNSAVIVSADGILFFTATSGAFSILPSTSRISPCDLNSDGVVNALDVQLAIAQALGSTPCSNADLDRNGICNVIDVQRIINAANGQACTIGN